MFRLVEIELHSYCNRKCDWCPNKNIPARQVIFKIMDASTLYAIITDLKRWNYKGYISFSRYNEPFAYFTEDESSWWQVNALRENLPNCTFVCNTNGDYLTEKIFKKAAEKIDELTIMNYDGLTKEECQNRLIEFTGNVNIKIEERDKGLYTEFEGMKVLYVVDWKNWNITDRGGSLPEYSSKERMTVCCEPKFFMGINYDGSISPCCNIRPDIPKHERFIMGNVNKKSLNEIYFSEKWLSFECIAAGIFLENTPCEFCQNHGGRYTRERGGIFYDE